MSDELSKPSESFLSLCRVGLRDSADGLGDRFLSTDAFSPRSSEDLGPKVSLTTTLDVRRRSSPLGLVGDKSGSWIGRYGLEAAVTRMSTLTTSHKGQSSIPLFAVVTATYSAMAANMVAVMPNTICRRASRSIALALLDALL